MNFEASQRAQTRRFLVTGGAGFIGSAFVRMLIGETSNEVLVVDKLTYAGNIASLAPVDGNPRYRFLKADINDAETVREALAGFRPHYVIHLAAESHVDRSIDGPASFIETNINGTFTLLQEALRYWSALMDNEYFRFHHVSTDEVFGSLSNIGIFTEDSQYRPNSPYAASKAASDHLVRAWHHTYGLPAVLSNCSNNYGPYQFPEKLIPTVILNALENKSIPVYGAGANIRDWLHVEDHARALLAIAERGRDGESYNVGANCERTNLDVVKSICASLQKCSPRRGNIGYDALIEFVKDHPGHDLRYAIDASKLMHDLGWSPREDFENGILNTVRWYLANDVWWQPIRTGVYRGERLGLTQS